jgi:hypothetical protein
MNTSTESSVNLQRIIFSRKGWDSGKKTGGRPSPIFEGDSMFSVPIPEDSASPSNYSDILGDGFSVGSLVEDLTQRRIRRFSGAHLDPDLNPRALHTRCFGWLPSLGQVAAAQTHLMNNDVKGGDLFLFFGWFRRVRYVTGKWEYNPSAAGHHVIFGWLQIGEVVPVGRNPSRVVAKYPWLVDHPHLTESYASYSPFANNTIYVARERLEIPGIQDQSIPGGGLFPRFDSSLVLTAPGQSNRSLWLLPNLFHPNDKQGKMTYHRDPKRWQTRDSACLLQTVGRGQEFVLKTADYPGIMPWVRALFARQEASW